MIEKTCCLTGHRQIKIYDKNKLKRKLKKEIVKLIEKGVLYFGCGGAIGFDTIAAETIIQLKKIFPTLN